MSPFENPLVWSEYLFCVAYLVFVGWTVLMVMNAEAKPNDTIGYFLYVHGAVWMAVSPVLFVAIILEHLN